MSCIYIFFKLRVKKKEKKKKHILLQTKKKFSFGLCRFSSLKDAILCFASNGSFTDKSCPSSKAKNRYRLHKPLRIQKKNKYVHFLRQLYTSIPAILHVFFIKFVVLEEAFVNNNTHDEYHYIEEKRKVN